MALLQETQLAKFYLNWTPIIMFEVNAINTCGQYTSIDSLGCGDDGIIAGGQNIAGERNNMVAYSSSIHNCVCKIIMSIASYSYSYSQSRDSV